MSTKQIVQDLLQKLPDDLFLHQIAQEIEFVAAVRQGLAEIDRGERIPIEDVERELLRTSGVGAISLETSKLNSQAP